MPEIISFVKKEANKKHQRIIKNHEEYAFSLCQDTNRREYQEDAMAWKTYPANCFVNSSPLAIGMRLWSTYQLINQEILRRLRNEKKEKRQIGSTACTTLYDGDQFLITASIADSCSFAVFYDEHDTPIKVIRLNRHLHKAEDLLEQQRVEEADGRVFFDGYHWRVHGVLIVSRALGDFYCKGVCSDARIDVLNLHEEKSRLMNNKTPAKKIQVITVSDGFTDGAPSNRDTDMELFLLQCLQERKGLSESQLTVSLVEAVTKIKVDDEMGNVVPKVRDNISIAVQTVKPQTPFIIGVFDGHGGGKIAQFCARHLFNVFDELMLLNPVEFSDLNTSPYQMKKEFIRDHQHLLNGKPNHEWIKNLALIEIIRRNESCLKLSSKSKLSTKYKIFKELKKTIFSEDNGPTVEAKLRGILSYLSEPYDKKRCNFDVLMEHTSPIAQNFCRLIEHHLRELQGLIKMAQFSFVSKWFKLTDVLKYEDYKFFSVSDSSSSDADEEKKHSLSEPEFSLNQASDDANRRNESGPTNNTNRF